MIIICGPFPPPVHGMSKNLLIFKDKIESKGGESLVLDISPHSLVRGRRYHFTKIKKVVSAIKKLVFLERRTYDEKINFYLPPDGGYGLVYSILITTAAKLKSDNIFFHHRSYAYINRYSKLMGFLNKVAGKKAVHIFLSEKMANDYSEKYKVNNYFVVSNLIHVKEWFELNLKPKKYNPDLIVLGFMSNISIEKGIKDAIDTVFKLRDNGLNVKLKIGGVCDNHDVEKYLNETISLHPHLFEFVGFVDKQTKLNFFRDLDWFLFPTRYVNEAQPNVLFESVAAGVPFITIERGCIKGDFLDYPYVMEQHREFHEFACNAIIDNLTPISYEANREVLIENVRHQVMDAEQKENDMFDAILS
ncbi:TPA: glycosyltransferase family 4 protein [Raoultella planticola]